MDCVGSFPSKQKADLQPEIRFWMNEGSMYLILCGVFLTSLLFYGVDYRKDSFNYENLLLGGL